MRVFISRKKYSPRCEQALRSSPRCGSRRPAASTAIRADPLAAAPRSTAGEGVSSTSFWCGLVASQSRSAEGMTLPWPSRAPCTSTCRGVLEVALSRSTVASEKYASPSRCRPRSAALGLLRRLDDLEPLPPPPAALDRARPAELSRGAASSSARVDRVGRAGTTGTPAAAIALAGGDLRAHTLDRLGRRADPAIAGSATARAKAAFSARNRRPGCTASAPAPLARLEQALLRR
jgi:hypothetical protein